MVNVNTHTFVWTPLPLFSLDMMTMMRTTTVAALLYATLSLLLTLETASASMMTFPEDLVAQAREFMAGGRDFEEQTHRRFMDSSVVAENQDYYYRSNAAAGPQYRRSLYEIEDELMIQQAPLMAGCAIAIIGCIIVICAHRRRAAEEACKQQHSSIPSFDDDGKDDDHTSRTTDSSSSSLSSSSSSSDDPIYLSETFGPDVGFRDEVYLQHFRIQQGAKDDDSSPMMVNIV